MHYFLRSMIVLGGLFVFICIPSAPVVAARPMKAPKIANWNYSWSIESDAQARTLAKWDVVILDVENAHYNRDRVALLRKLNPNIKILAYISPVDIRADAAFLDVGTERQAVGQALVENPQWVLRKADGTKAHWWMDYTIMNITDRAQNSSGQTFNSYFSDFIRDTVIKDPVWDGIFYDNLWEGVAFVSTQIDLNNDHVAESSDDMDAAWRAGIQTLLKNTRKNAKTYRGKSFIITGNGGAQYYRLLNGVGFEGYPNSQYGGWVESTKKYAFILENAQKKRYVFINTHVGNTGNQMDYKKFRFGLASALLYNGYYSFDNGDMSHAEQWYYDEYDVDLGDAISGAYNLLRPDNPTAIEGGVWRRDYESATVIANSTDSTHVVDLKTGFEKLHGTQDASVNNGEVVGSVEIAAQDGVVLLPRLSSVRDTTFVNGAYSKIFDQQGIEVRNSFFSYDGSFAGGTQIHKISAKNRTVVASDTFVQVYDSANRKIAEFAPYGTGYSGGINIAVGRLRKGKKDFIVVGNKTGPAQVRIYGLKGRLVNTGCYPFSQSFTGGVNVAVGDLNGDKRKEIIVAAGFGGAPQIRILDNRCRTLSPGFFAFEKSWRTGVNVAVGDMNGDGKEEIIAAAGTGAAPEVRIFRKNGKLLSSGFLAYADTDRTGVFVSTADVNGDGKDEIVTNSFSIFNLF